VPLTYQLKDGDLIHHHTIRREPPVFNIPFQIIFQNQELIVINKPPSIPVHPCGQFHYNSVVGVMEHEMKIKVTEGTPKY
jgi:23S rRNA-/tRNA-specific pseudouridylate synthase